ncbi:MAG: hypothetical protein BGP01_11085 [Paludibacter sp. 47-17]|nr:MAG: hypothetical protein ABS72_01280 [Paludibacter sp. SCN 50-10]OJX90940.1 MAG: hypothetical protein BGP01_11085 [Paludibacter sp. 47-17]
MKKIILLMSVVVLVVSCSDDFLERYPKGRWHHANYTSEDSLDISILVESKLGQSYANLRNFWFSWAGLAMHNYTTPDVEKGSTPSDGSNVAPFKTMSYTASLEAIRQYYGECYNSIYFANEALILANSMNDTVAKKNRLMAESLFMRSIMYYRLAQAFGGVPYVDKVLLQTDKTPARSTREQVWAHIERDLKWAIDYLPTRVQLNAENGSRRISQNAARALLAKVYLYQKKWSDVVAQTSLIISSGDNDMTTPYAEIFTEAREYGPESVFEVYCERRPSEQITTIGSQHFQIQGFRGVPNLGWGFNAPSQLLIAAYEPGDPRRKASVIQDGDTLDGRKTKADAASYKFFNKKAYVSLAERNLYGRATDPQGYWSNIRIIRYADVLLMHAEASLESGNTTEALDKLEMVRARARAGNAAVLPKVTTTNVDELRRKIRFERRIELAMEWERFFDLVRWDEAKDVIPGFVVGKHEVFPIPQSEIDKSEGVIVQNPNY